MVDGQPRIVADPPLLVPVNDLLPAKMDQETFRGQIKDLLGTYRRTLETDRRYLLEEFQFADMARKVVGVGSVGTRCWIVLLFGRDNADPLFLQVKEAEASVLSRFVGTSKYANQGLRVVAGQRLRRQGPPGDRRCHRRRLPAGDAQLRHDDQSGHLVRACGRGLCPVGLRVADEDAAAQDDRQGDR